MDYEQYLPKAIEIGKKAGAMIKEGFSLHITPDYKPDGTPVTEVDLAVNAMVLDALMKAYPDHRVLAEEGSTEDLDSEFIWVCDPIDGTLGFTNGLTISMFTLALTHNGKPVVGVLVDPYRDLTYTAVLGQGAYLNGKKIYVNDKKTLKGGVIDISHKMQTTVARLLQEGAHLTAFAAYIYSAKQVATGHFIGAIYRKVHAWDAAAIKIIVEEAGGKATDLDGNDQRYDRDINGCVVSNGHVHDKLIEILKNR